MKNKTAFITGGCGYVGREVVKKLLSLYHRITILDRHGCDTTWIKSSKIEMLYGDICKIETFANKIEPKSDVLHFAAFGGGRRETFKSFRQLNVQGTANLLDACIQRAAGRFIFISSVAAAGSLKNGRFDGKPRSIYGISKREAEEYIFKKAQGKIAATIIRPPLIYAPQPHRDSGVYNLVKFTKGRFYPIVGDGKNYLCLCSLSNLVRAIVFCLNSSQLETKTYFVRDERLFTYKQFVRKIIKLSSSKARVVFVPKILFSIAAYISLFVSWVLQRNFGLPFDTYLGATSNRLFFETQKIKKAGFVAVDSFEEDFTKILEQLK